MKRDITRHLTRWYQKTDRMPLLIRGDRQVGKTYAIEQFGADHFDSIITINFEQQIEYRDCFNSLYPDESVNKI